jgi:1-acyl-sn-glycerol-3-phosphate acyltransferase
VDIHFLEPVPTAGLTYDDRDSLSQTVRARMTELLEREYGVKPVEESGVAVAVEG